MTIRSIALSLFSCCALALACSSDDASDAGAGVSATACAPGTKRCGADCVSASLAVTGCAATSCSPCALPRASAVCGTDGLCKVSACENARGDCNGDPADGCETDLTSTSTHCGACGVSCGAGACKEGACVDAAVIQTAAWLDGQAGGFCHAPAGALMNLCGDVEFCADMGVLRAHAGGLELDVGFDWDGVDTDGNIVDVGGDCDNQRVSLRIEKDDAGGVLLRANGPQKGGGLAVPILAGRHLVGYRVDEASSALFLDGRKVAEGPGAGATPNLVDKCGPGFVLGHRISYWWEDTDPKSVYYLRFAPFFAHLRDGAGPTGAWTLAGATSPGQGTVAFFDAAGANGSLWTPKVGAQAGVGKNGSTWVTDTRSSCLNPTP